MYHLHVRRLVATLNYEKDNGCFIEETVSSATPSRVYSLLAYTLDYAFYSRMNQLSVFTFQYCGAVIYNLHKKEWDRYLVKLLGEMVDNAKRQWTTDKKENNSVYRVITINRYWKIKKDFFLIRSWIFYRFKNFDHQKKYIFLCVYMPRKTNWYFYWKYFFIIPLCWNFFANTSKHAHSRCICRFLIKK